MKISVVTVCYNAENSIEETIISVINQTYKDYEYLIIDGASKDSTLDIIRKYLNEKMKLISEPDDGIYDAMNKALRIASGDYLIFIGADDHFISYNILENVSKYLENKDIVYYGNVLRSIRNDVYCGRFSKWKLAIKNISHQAIFYPQCVYKNFSYDMKYQIFADYAYNLYLFKRNNYKYIPLTVTYYNDLGTSSTNKDQTFKSDYGKLTKENLGMLPNIYATCYHFLRNIIKGGK